MRNKFFELIEKGVAPASYVDVVTDHPAVSDDVIREYNNIFSLVSDTHMDFAAPELKGTYPEHDWKYIITGSLIGYSEQRWEKFCCDPSTHAGAFNPRPAGYYSPADFFGKVGLIGEKKIVNGDIVYLLYDMKEGVGEQVPSNPGVADTCGIEGDHRFMMAGTPPGVPVQNSYTTTESAIPHPIAELSVNVNKRDVQECFKHKNNLYEVAQAMNESESVLGENWVVFENQIVGYIGNKTVIIK